MSGHLLDCYFLCFPLILSSFSQICHDYNNGDGEFGRCEDGAGCIKLHICETFVSQDCNCSKAHDFQARQTLKILRDKGLPNTLIGSLRCIYANKEALRLSDRRRGNGQRGKRQHPQKTPTEICMYYIKGHCKHMGE